MKITPVRNLSGRGEILSIPHLVSPPPSLSTFHLSPFHPLLRSDIRRLRSIYFP